MYYYEDEREQTLDSMAVRAEAIEPDMASLAERLVADARSSDISLTGEEVFFCQAILLIKYQESKIT
jgi:hypothetical protein